MILALVTVTIYGSPNCVMDNPVMLLTGEMKSKQTRLFIQSPRSVKSCGNSGFVARGLHNRSLLLLIRFGIL